MAKADIDLEFPNLSPADYVTTSLADDGYNCFCWAIRDGKSDVWCSPTRIKGYYWPPNLPRDATVATFIKLYHMEGSYTPCDNGDLEGGYEKVVLYVDSKDEVCHAARQLPTGRWTSKLGILDDIDHVNASVLEADYGPIKQFLKRPKT